MAVQLSLPTVFESSEIWLLLCEKSPTVPTNKLRSWFSQTNTRADKTVCKDIALQRQREEKKDQITLLHTVLCYLIDPASPRSSTNITYIHLAREYWVSSRRYEMHHLANMWKQHKQKDETFITMNPHKWKYYYSHTVLKHILAYWMYMCMSKKLHM